MKKILLLLILGIFLINLASAFDWTDGRLISYWNFDEGSGTSAVDATNHLHNGTLQNSVDWVNGKLGTAVNFTYAPNNQWINVSNREGFTITGATNNLSVNAWVYVIGQQEQISILQTNIGIGFFM